MARYYPDYNSTDLQPKKIFSRACPGKRFDSVTYRKYMSMLFKKAEEFLCTQQSREEVIRSKIKILDEYRKRDIKSLYRKKLKEVESDLKATEIGDYNLDLLRHELAIRKYYYSSDGNNLNEAMGDLDMSGRYLLKYFVSFASIVSYMFSDMNSNLKIYPESKFPEAFFRNFDFKKYLEEHEVRDSSISELEHLDNELINHDLVLIDDPGSADNYFALKNFLNIHIGRLSSYKKVYQYKKLISYCMRMRRQSKTAIDFDQEIFEHYSVLIEYGLAFGDNEPTIHYNDFRIFIDSALKSGNRESAKKFIEFLSAKSDSESSLEILDMGRARLLYDKQHFDECLETLASVKPVSETMGMDLYSMKFFCLYDLNHTASALNLLDTFRHHVSYNRQISAQYAESFKRFINFSKKLLRLRKKPSEDKSKKLFEDITRDNLVSNKRWMLGKLKELEEQCYDSRP